MASRPRPWPRPHTPKANAKVMTSRPRHQGLIPQGQGHGIKAKAKIKAKTEQIKLIMLTSVCNFLSSLNDYYQFWDWQKWQWHEMTTTSSETDRSDSDMKWLLPVLRLTEVTVTWNVYYQFWDWQKWQWHEMTTTSSETDRSDSDMKFVACGSQRISCHCQEKYWY